MNSHNQASDDLRPQPYWQWDTDDKTEREVSPPLPGPIPTSLQGTIGATTAPTAAASRGLKASRAGAWMRLPSLRLLGALVCLLLLATLGSLSGRFFAHLVPAHRVATPPSFVNKRGMDTPGPTTTSGQARKQNAPRPSPGVPSHGTPAPAPSPTMPPSLLAQDDFARPDQPGWGLASDGERWAGDANRSAAFAIRRQHGQIGEGTGFFTALLGPDETDADVSVSGTISSFAHGQANLGIVVRYQNEANYDKVYLDGTALVLIQRRAGHLLVLDAVPFVARANVSYTLRLRTIGMLLLARAWPSTTSEPRQWMVIGQDEALTHGRSGIRVLLARGVEVAISAFIERRAR
jgi:hypothetical protein